MAPLEAQRGPKKLGDPIDPTDPGDPGDLGDPGLRGRLARGGSSDDPPVGHATTHPRQATDLTCLRLEGMLPIWPAAPTKRRARKSPKHKGLYDALGGSLQASPK